MKKTPGWVWLLVGLAAAAIIGGGAAEQALLPPADDSSGSSSSTVSNIIQRVAQAIASAEGFFAQGSVPQRQNNPGDIAAGGAIANYATPDEGWNALYHQVSLMFQGPPASHFAPTMTISQIAYIYANGEKDPVGASNWANNVAGYLGVSTETTLNDLQA